MSDQRLTECLGEFNAHVAETTHAGNADFVARVDAIVLEWRVVGNECR